MGEQRFCCSDFLFARPSFLSGLARSLDIFGHYDEYNLSRSEQEADYRALLCDWLIAQQDIDSEWDEIVKEHPDYIEALAIAISKDQFLCRVVNQLAEKKQHEFEMAAQDA